MASLGTPKFKSKEFKETLGQLKQIFDAHSLGIILLDALERRAAEQIFGKISRGSRGARLASLPKAELVGQLTAGFFADDGVAFQLVRDLDRTCQKERHIVASIPEAEAPKRIGSYRAISLKRERAKFVWALSRDARGPVRTLANTIISEFFAEAADVETTRAVLEGEAPKQALDQLDMAKRLKEQAERLAEASEQVTDLESKLKRFEQERARLLAQLGAKERSLNEQTGVREDLEVQVQALRASLASVEEQQAQVESDRIEESQARARAEDLAQKVRRLSKLAGASEALVATQGQLDAARRTIESLERTQTKLKEAHAAELSREADAQQKLRTELEESRHELKQVRRQLETERRGVSAEDIERPTEGVVILLDQANLAATAQATFSRKVNFSRLLDELTFGRPLIKALAFVVDNGGQHFERFCDTLRRSGWELRVKKPKRFGDGRTKADWDMGIAMEAVALRDRAPVIVLASGDGDFAPLVKQLRRWGQRVEVAAYSDGLAADLVNSADAVTRLGTRTLE
ncbi:MAG: NYN domain-containing protein [Myxococcota bacterium]